MHGTIRWSLHARHHQVEPTCTAPSGGAHMHGTIRWSPHARHHQVEPTCTAPSGGAHMHGTIRWSPHDDKTRAIHTRNDTHTKDPNMIPLSSVAVFTLGVILSRIAKKKKLTPTSVCVSLPTLS